MEGERFSLAKPTQGHVEDYNIAAAEFSEQLGKLRTLVEVDLVKLEKDLEARARLGRRAECRSGMRSRRVGHGFARIGADRSGWGNFAGGICGAAG